jgi:hypothetical protein
MSPDIRKRQLQSLVGHSAVICPPDSVEGRLEKLLAHLVGRRQAIIEVKDQGFCHVARDED